MITPADKETFRDADAPALRSVAPPRPREIEVALLTGGFDRPYAFGLSLALASIGVCLDVIGSDDVDTREMHTTPAVRFLNLQRNTRQSASFATRAARVLAFYARLFRYVSTAKPKLFHILWNNKLQYFDRTLLLLYYKCLGKKIIFTAHNVNAGKRDSNDSVLNRLTLKIQYHLVDHIFVHTQQMKAELREDFGVNEKAITVIPFGVNNAVPCTNLTPAEAKLRLNVKASDRVILFFGNIGPYKGLEFLVDAFRQIVGTSSYRLLIAGKARGDCEEYLKGIREGIGSEALRNRVTATIEYIPDEETEIYFKAADVLVLPYTQVSQSGVLFLGYSFGLPVIATDVGAFREDIAEGMTGFLCRPCDAADLKETIDKYFKSDMFKSLDERRREIQNYAKARNSWDVVASATCNVYKDLIGREAT